VKPLLDGGEILAAGARTITSGGWQSLRLWRCRCSPDRRCRRDAQLPKIKGIHQAIRSGMLAAEHLVETSASTGFDACWRASVGGLELRQVRNIAPGMKRGLWFGLLNGAWETYVTRGASPWTLKNKADWSKLERLDEFESPERGWGARTLPPRDRVSRCFLPATRTMRISRCTCTSRTHPSASSVAPANSAIPARTSARRASMKWSRTARAAGAADQRRQLRALQGLRHQRSVRNHYLDHARGRLRTELPNALIEIYILSPLRENKP